jgi:hypothetical protein
MHSGWKPLYYLFKMLLSIFVTLLRADRRIRLIIDEAAPGVKKEEQRKVTKSTMAGS